MIKTWAITLADNSVHYVSAATSASAKSKLSVRFPSAIVKSCKLCKDN